MPTNLEWAVGYYSQALADMAAADVLQGQEPSVTAMLLQMVLEKLGKAALLRGGQIGITQATSSHRAAGRMMQSLGRDARACQRLGFSTSLVSYTIRPLVQELEDSQPSLGGKDPCKPRLEYPWASAAGEI